jgi:hypothetical protein
LRRARSRARRRGLERDDDQPGRHACAALALGHHHGPIGRSLARRRSAQRQPVERATGLIDQARVVGSGAYEEVGSARDDFGQIVGAGMTAVGDAHLARPRTTAGEALGLAALGHLDHAKAQLGEVEDGMHEPVAALVAGWHHGGGVHRHQAVPACVGHHRLRVALGQERSGDSTQPVSAGPQPIEEGDIRHRRQSLGIGPGRERPQRQAPQDISEA